jgi:hypothetical protein
MANHSINFAEEASKLTAVFSASYQKFEAEIKRLTTENNQAVKRLTMENKELREKIAKMQSVASESPNPSEDAPEDFNPIPDPIRGKRRRRGPNRPAEAAARCQALTNSIMINEDGEMRPSQCKRPTESNSSFCWGHIVNQVCGTVQQPDLEAFNSIHDRLLKRFNKKNGIVDAQKSRRTKPAQRYSLKAIDKNNGGSEAKRPQWSESARMHSTNSFTVDVSSEDSESDSDSEDLSAERPSHELASERQRRTAPLGLHLSETLPMT